VGLPAQQSLLRLWSLRRPDLVHIATEGPLGWSALKAARKLKLPVSSDFRTNFHAYSHHYRLGWLEPLVLGYLKRFHALADRNFVPTNEMARQLAAHGFQRLDVVGRGVDAQRFSPVWRDPMLRQQWNARPQDPVLLHVGRLAAEKNVDLALGTFEQLRLLNPGVRMVVVGDGPQRKRRAA
jgi:glycosyltransferase involved in cell wall biosynthesis